MKRTTILRSVTFFAIMCVFFLLNYIAISSNKLKFIKAYGYKKPTTLLIDANLSSIVMRETRINAHSDPTVTEKRAYDEGNLRNVSAENTSVSTTYVDRHTAIDWQKVGDILQAYIYSAIYDDIETPIIRVITVARGPNGTIPSPVYTCLYHDESGDMIGIDVGRLQYVPEPIGWGYSYRSGMIKCELPTSLKPYAVSIRQNATSTGDNSLTIIYPVQKKWQLTRCYSVLHGNFDNVMQIIQTMELSLMFGIDHYVIYIQSVSQSVLRVLHRYRDMGILEVLTWNIPLNRSQIHYFGQLAVLQDCLYRNLHVSEYVLTGDTDEVFVPKMHPNIQEMIDDSIKRKQCSCLIIRNSFFPLNLHQHREGFPSKSQAERLNITYLLYTNHLVINWPTDRSKLIFRPPDIEIVGIHSVEKLRRGRHSCVCHSDRCLLHHYRPVPKHEWKSFRATDTSLHLFSDVFVKRVEKILKDTNFPKAERQNR